VDIGALKRIPEIRPGARRTQTFKPVGKMPRGLSVQNSRNGPSWPISSWTNGGAAPKVAADIDRLLETPRPASDLIPVGSRSQAV
jgi:hypothetical protein